MSRNMQDVHGLLDKEQREQAESEIRHVLGLRSCEMNDEDYDAVVALLRFMGKKPRGVALSGEIISFLGSKPYGLSPCRIADLLKYLSRENFICTGGIVERRHALGNLPIQLTSWRERVRVTVQ